MITLFAAPDPDLFDGRVITLSSESESTAGLSESSGNEFRDNSSEDGSAGVGGSEGVERRNSEGVGGPGGGKAVEGPSSKVSSSSGGGGFSEATSKVEASSASIGSAGTSTTEPSGGSGFGNQEPRNFEDFGFGGAGALETVEVNRSKEIATPVRLSSGNSTIPPEVNDFTAAAGQEATGGSQAGNGSLGGDYGTNLPSGL